MQSRFAIVLTSIAGAGLLFCIGLLFGLGVMSSPKGGEHKEIAVTNEPVKVARRETTGSAGTPSDDLTPLTPVHPGTSAPVRTAQAPQSQPPAPPAASVTKEAKTTPAAATAPEPAKPAAAEKPAAPANATPVGLHARNSCDVQACSRAYKSFRESDCTYQPYSGPRQLCVSPPAPAKEASRSDDRSAVVRVRSGNRDIEVQNVPHESARVTDGASPRDDEGGPVLRRQIRRDLAADGEDDGIDDSRVIVRRSEDDRGWHRRFFAPVEDDDDDQ